MRQQLKLIVFAIVHLFSIWMMFVSFADSNVSMFVGALLTFLSSLLFTWSEIKMKQ